MELVVLRKGKVWGKQGRFFLGGEQGVFFWILDIRTLFFLVYIHRFENTVLLRCSTTLL